MLLNLTLNEVRPFSHVSMINLVIDDVSQINVFQYMVIISTIDDFPSPNINITSMGEG